MLPIDFFPYFFSFANRWNNMETCNMTTIKTMEIVILEH